MKPRSLVGGILVGIGAAYGVLLVPEPVPDLSAAPSDSSFAWDRNAYWSELEAAFVAARNAGCDVQAASISAWVERLRAAIATIEEHPLEPADPTFEDLQESFFASAPVMAACPSHAGEWVKLSGAMRAAVKRQSQHWDVDSQEVKTVLYRLLYGSRLAIEEVMLQQPPGTLPALLPGTAEPSAAPSAEVRGVIVHSGDLLVSRGGAPTSALIARGNDFPGNFSHVALAHVDEDSAEVSIIEAHIECGVAISSLDDYLSDTKLRVMVLRVRADHPAVVADPMLPHRAATGALERARSEHIPYDFEMDFDDASKLFCSEVASSAYQEAGITLWMSLSSISGRAVVPWLADFGVRNFVTQAPSDLEYDPQLTVVAEWRDPDALFDDHVDNAIIDAMFEGAGAGSHLDYSRARLPAARALKAYSVTVEALGHVGPLPEGMSATAALRNQSLSQRHEQARARTLELVRAFDSENGYRPPYWELVRLARNALEPG